ncbi:hypothetical protein [Rossellomorea marisflavi]|uniref:hypothetical protein n=1 Tax=Rossellomorea marisflavi TaxID=189381 RepID=UPI00345C809B
MKSDFFNELKSFVMKEHKDDKSFIKYIGYYETLLQNQDKLKPLLDDMENWMVEFHFNEDDTQGYTYGKYTIYLWKYGNGEPVSNSEEEEWFEREYSPHYYTISLVRDERHWGYCQCEPDHKGYSVKHGCCGAGCDWTAPGFVLNKVYSTSGTFQGMERDLWKLEEKWEADLADYNRSVNETKINRINESIERLMKEKKELEQNT